MASIANAATEHKNAGVLIIACGALSIIGLIISAIGTGVTGIALISSNPDFKVKLYRAAMYLMFFSSKLFNQLHM